ncbi:MAG: DUF11 domain-containing protein [Bacteroidota bacterium]|jgi:uncharacterized repeat protein (TIGR01451 family)
MIKLIKYLNVIIGSPVNAIVLLMLAVSVEAFSAGTPAGTVIQSRSRAVYTTASGAVSDTVYSNTVSFTVSQIGSFNISPASSQNQSVSDSAWVLYPLTITNSGNGMDKGFLSAQSSRGWTVQIFGDGNGDGILQPVEVSAGALNETPSLTADSDFKIFLRVFVPRGDGLDGTKDTSLVTVTSVFDNTKTINSNQVTTAQTANLGIASSLTSNTPVPEAGTNVIFTVTLHNTGSTNASGVVISDLIPDQFTIVSGSTSQGSFSSAANPVQWNIGTISPGSTVTATITLLVNSSNPIGTVLTNQMTVLYSVGANSYAQSTNTAQLIVGGISTRNVAISAMWTSLTKEALDTAVYRFNVGNTGTLKDIFTLNETSSLGFNWILFRDVNNNLTLDGADIQITATDSLAAGDSVRIFARAFVPRVSGAGGIDTLKVIAGSIGDVSKKDTAKVITSILAPVVAISKSVFPVGNQPPGTEMTYTISYSNSGSVGVSNFSIVDRSPSPTVYVANSIKLNGTALLDNSSAVSVTDDGTGNKIIAVSVGTLNAQSSGSVEFKVKIK